MNINKIGAVQYANKYSKQQAISKTTKTEEKTDKIQISEVGKKLSIYGNIENLNREEKINKLTELVKSGNYKIDSKDIAQKMLGNKR